MDRFFIAELEASPATDAAVEQLLHEVYVEGGFTAPDMAVTTFRAEAVRSRGSVFAARSSDGAIIGMALLVIGGSVASRLAPRGDAELQLLAVSPAARTRGVGHALVQRILDEAARYGVQHVWLWTQSRMAAAQRLYERLEFQRMAPFDFSRGLTQFQVYRRETIAMPVAEGTPHGSA